MEEGGIETRQQSRTFDEELGEREHNLIVMSELARRDDRMALCVPLVPNAAACLIAFRDRGDSLDGANVVKISVCGACRQGRISCTNSITLKRDELKKNENWTEKIRETCRQLCGKASVADDFLPFAKLRKNTSS